MDIFYESYMTYVDYFLKFIYCWIILSLVQYFYMWYRVSQERKEIEEILRYIYMYYFYYQYC